ncbi:SMK killer toxin resistance protein [Coniochaeta pulveracea]|uniref:SMK killer toxin resistance protein n=1 Tax=Coniochaeta pulveracea TaxID=177199 RepID=A0A420XYX1_9PEZI|nr:SMK killer toxin resistance protein [Coniochaeta pulveracea]
MATFVQELWDSIFTPGPTPTLLIATNVTFAALQLVLFTLLVATWSIHFVAQEEEKARRAKDTPIGKTVLATSDSETEVEASSSGKGRRQGSEPVKETDIAIEPVTGSKEVEILEQTGELKQRAAVSEALSASSQASSGSKSGVSTEDEWEKVSENENEKDK